MKIAPPSSRDIVIAAGVDKLLSDKGHHECISLPRSFLGLSSPYGIISREYHWSLRDRAQKFRTAF